MKRNFCIFISMILCFYITSCTKINNTIQTSSDTVVEYTQDVFTYESDESLPSTSEETVINKSKAQLTLESMSTEEKIAQLFIITPEVLDNTFSTSSSTQLTDTIKTNISKYPVGGIILFAKNIVTPEQLKSFTSDLQSSSNIPLLIATDEEGGSVARIANSKNFNVKKYSSMQKIGKTNDPNNAYDVGVTIGSYLKDYGINVDFAPVADVNTNPDNIVIGNRAFGNEPNLVASMVAAAINGFHNSNIITCVKHFPGHGDTHDDTHKGMVSIDKTWDELKLCELIPFQKAIEAETDMIMVAHISAKSITGSNIPASLSYEIITEKLRNEMNYNGVVITDSLQMGAITDIYTSKESAINAILAGADIVLMPYNFYNAFDGVCDAVKQGKISEERLNQSVLRILTLKEKYGLL